MPSLAMTNFEAKEKPCMSFTGIFVALPIFDFFFARNFELFVIFVFDIDHDVLARKRRSSIPHKFLEALS